MSAASWSRQLLTFVCFLALILLVCCAPTASKDEDAAAEDSVDKRGGARAFSGSRGLQAFSSSKRLSGGSPYFWLDKRGGGRAFYGGRAGWPAEFGGFRMERRGGGRAFAGDWNGDALGRYYEPSYMFKRSIDYVPYDGFY